LAPAPGDAPPTTATASAPTARLLATWIVRPGDSFWSIAETVIGQARMGAERPAIAPYWSRLVAANRDRLPYPGDPDLLFAGDVLVLPPLTAGPT
jgi:nucleoid-associated protein YgaU